MTKLSSLVLITLIWLLAVWATARDSSYAQQLTTLRLPFAGEVSADGPPGAFSILNTGEFIAVRAEGGEAGVLGIGSYGLVGKGDHLGLYGEGLTYGVGGKSEGLAGVVGKVTLVAKEDIREVDGTVAIKQGDTYAPSYGYLGTRTSGVHGVGFEDDGFGVSGAFVRPRLKNEIDRGVEVRGVTRGFLGTPRVGAQGESEIPNGLGVAGKAHKGANAVGVYGESDSGFAGFFRGKATITGDLLVGVIRAKAIYAEKGLVGQNAGKFFTIDHPLDPENQYLVHSSVESSEYKNFYDGIATLDANGAAVVGLPHWFEALNKDFRYQLTPIGAAASLYIGREIEQGSFQIAGGKPGMRVSWAVTGVRRDRYASAHPVEVEQPKTAGDRGKYLAPREYGLPETRGINYRSDQTISLNSKSNGGSR
jgi:hypothetical protein